MTSEAIKIIDVNILTGLDGEVQLLLKVDKQIQDRARIAVQKAAERLKQGKEVGVTVEQIKRRRSLDANAYFHVLCSKIAEKTRLSMDEVKSNMVVNYGAPMYAVTIPSNADISAMWAYSRFIGEDNGKAEYWLYKQTHTLNSSEMARLINGAIQEAQQLDIQTLTPNELADIQRKWEEHNDSNKKARDVS